MLSIETRFLGPTNTKGARYVATTANGHRVVVSKDYGFTDEQEHARAAMKLASTMLYGPQEGWLAGSTKSGYVFVPVGGNVYHETRTDPRPTYTIRRPGCTAWATGVSDADLADKTRRANQAAPGHIVVADD